MAADKRRVFVSIPSYRDSECGPTIADLFARAAFPDRVRVGVCWQYDPDADAALVRHPALQSPHVRQVFVHFSQARGPCYARHLAHGLWAGEAFHLQVDSHMRFAVGWDERLMRMWEQCGDERAIITTYPPSYTLSNNRRKQKQEEEEDAMDCEKDAPVVVLCASEFHSSDGMLRITGKRLERRAKSDDKPRPGLFWAAGFAFSRASVLADVPYDPTLDGLFFGEEQLMAARLWTSGYRFYVPTRTLVWHLWSRAHRPSFREVAPTGSEAEQRSRDRVQRILAGSVGDDDPYTLGSHTTMKAYEQAIGVNFQSRTISEHARRGGCAEEELEPDKLALLMQLVGSKLAPQ